MKKLLFLCCFILCTSVFATETIVKQWEFNTPGDVEGWAPGSIRDLKVENGALVGTFTGRDPILSGPQFEIPTKKGIMFEIRMKSPITTRGELFYTNTNEGQFGGYDGSRMRTWEIFGDNEFHTYRFFPGWTKLDKIIKMRVDPGTPAEELWDRGQFEIDYIRLVDLNFDTTPAPVEVWSFSNPDTFASWHVDGTCVKTANGVNVVGILKSKPVRLSGDALGSWVTLELATTAGSSATVRLVNDVLTKGAEVMIPLKNDGKPHFYNVLLSEEGFSVQDVSFLEIRVNDAGDTPWNLRTLSFSDSPSGPATLEIQEDAGLTDAINRAGRSLPLEFTLENRGGETVRNVRLRALHVPDGMRVTSRDFPQDLSLDPFCEYACKFQVTADRALEGVVKLTLGADNVEDVTFEIPVQVLSSLGLPNSEYVPEPQPVSSDYEIGALYFPGWAKASAWERIFVAPIRKPVLGWYDESNPEVVDWQIKWALENGIQYFLVDWYWNRGSQSLDHWVKAFQKAKYRSKFRWAMMWANHNGPGSHSLEDQAAVTKFWIENYFNTKEYYRIDDRPVVMIWSPAGMDRDMQEIYAKQGVTLEKGQGVKKLLDLSQEMARAAGFKGIYFIAMKWPEASTRAEDVQWLADAGFEMTSLYHFMSDGGKAENSMYFNYDLCVEATLPYLRARQETGILPFLPNLATGWDSRPWHGLRQTVIYGRTPEKFRKVCEEVKRFADESGMKNIVLAPLNEWGEGSYAEPNREFGFAMYEAVRDTFCKKPEGGWPLNYGPRDVGLGPYDLQFATPQERMRTSWDFQNPPNEQGWQNLMGCENFAVTDGVLSFRTTTRDPAVSCHFSPVFAKSYEKIVFRIRYTSADGTELSEQAQLFWQPLSMALSEATSTHFPVRVDGQWHDYTVPLSGLPTWRGQIGYFRFDPLSRPGVTVEIDAIRLEK